MLNMYRLTKDLNMKCRKKIKLLEDNSDEYLCGLKLEKNFKYAKKKILARHVLIDQTTLR